MTDSPDDRRGVVTPEPDGGRRIVFRRSWPDPIDDVWSALTENERTANWIGTYAGERGSGGTGSFSMTHEAGDEGMPMTIVECEPPRRLVLQWPEPLSWRVELDLSEESGRTVLVFTQVLPSVDGLGDIATGWHWYLDGLDAEITGGPRPPEWDAFVAQLGAVYAPDPA